MSKRNTLTPRDWTIAAMHVLAERGVDAISVEGIAKQIGTSKGSFYWHFADRRALLRSVFDLWEQEGTVDLIERAKVIDDPIAGLRALARDTLDRQSNGIDVAQIESAIRAWASRDPEIGPRFTKVEQDRTAFLAAQIALLGYDATTALQLSKVIHLAVIGLFAARASGSSLADDEILTFMIERIIGDAPRPENGSPP